MGWPDGRRWCAALVLLAGCAAQTRMSYVTYSSAVMRVPMEYAVYTPPGFRPEEALPLVVFLHGGGDSERSFEEWSVAAELDRAIAAGEIPRIVLVAPDGDLGFWTDWHDGSKRFETWVVDEVIPRVAERYGTKGCHLVGVSMGASGALRFALHNPGMFGSVALLSGPMFDSEQMMEFANDRLFSIFVPTHRVFGPTGPAERWRIGRSDPWVRWRSQEDLGGTRLFVGWAAGDREGIVRSNRELVEHLRERGVAHTAREFPGEHGWAAWKPVILSVLATQIRVSGDTASPADNRENRAD